MARFQRTATNGRFTKSSTSRSSREQRRTIRNVQAEQQRQQKTYNIITKYGIDVRKYQNDPNYIVKTNPNGTIKEIRSKPVEYTQTYSKRTYYNKRVSPPQESKQLYSKEIITFSNGVATITKNSVQQTGQTYSGGRRSHYVEKTYSLVPTIEKYSKGSIISKDVYGVGGPRGYSEVKRDSDNKQIGSYQDSKQKVYLAQSSNYKTGKSITYPKPQKRIEVGGEKRRYVEQLLRQTGQKELIKEKVNGESVIDAIIKDPKAIAQLEKKAGGVYKEQQRIKDESMAIAERELKQYIDSKIKDPTLRKIALKNQLSSLKKGRFVDGVPYEIYKNYKKQGVNTSALSRKEKKNAIDLYIKQQEAITFLEKRIANNKEAREVEEYGKFSYLRDIMNVSGGIKAKAGVEEMTRLQRQEEIVKLGRKLMLMNIWDPFTLKQYNSSSEKIKRKVYNTLYEKYNGGICFYNPKTKTTKYITIDPKTLKVKEIKVNQAKGLTTKVTVRVRGFIEPKVIATGFEYSKKNIPLIVSYVKKNASINWNKIKSKFNVKKARDTLKDTYKRLYDNYALNEKLYAQKKIDKETYNLRKNLFDITKKQLDLASLVDKKTGGLSTILYTINTAQLSGFKKLFSIENIKDLGITAYDFFIKPFINIAYNTWKDYSEFSSFYVALNKALIPTLKANIKVKQGKPLSKKEQEELNKLWDNLLKTAKKGERKGDFFDYLYVILALITFGASTQVKGGTNILAKGIEKIQKIQSLPGVRGVIGRKATLLAKIGGKGLNIYFTSNAIANYIDDPKLSNLALAYFFTKGTVKDLRRTINKLISTKTLPNAKNLKLSYETHKRLADSYSYVAKKIKPQLRLLKGNQKTVTMERYEYAKVMAEYHQTQYKFQYSLYKQKDFIPMTEVNPPQNVKKWVSELDKLAGTKTNIKLYHATEGQVSTFMKGKRLLTLSDVKKLIKDKGLVSPKKLNYKIRANNKYDKVVLDFIKGKDIRIYGGTSVSAYGNFWGKLKNMKWGYNDLDFFAKNPLKTGNQLLKILNKKFPNVKFTLKQAQHKGTYKILKNGKEFIDISKIEKGIGRVLGADGVSYVGLEWQVTSLFDRILTGNKVSKSVKYINIMTKGKIKNIEVIPNIKGGFQVQLPSDKFLGARRKYLEKLTGQPIRQMFFDQEFATYYLKDSKKPILLVFDNAVISKYPKKIQKQLIDYINGKIKTKEQYAKLMKEALEYANKTPNKFLPGLPKNFAQVEEREVLLSLFSIVNVKFQKLNTYLPDGRKVTILKAGLNPIKKSTLLERIITFWQKRPLAKWKNKIYDIDYMVSLGKIDKMTMATKKPSLIRKFKTLKIKLVNYINRLISKTTRKTELNKLAKALKSLGVSFTTKFKKMLKDKGAYKKIKAPKKKPTPKFKKKVSKTKLDKLKAEERQAIKKLNKDIENTNKLRKALMNHSSSVRLRVLRGNKVIIPVFVRRLLKTKRRYYQKGDMRNIRRQIERLRNRIIRLRKRKPTPRKPTPRKRPVRRRIPTRVPKRKLKPRTRTPKRKPRPRTRIIKRPTRTRRPKRTPPKRTPPRKPPVKIPVFRPIKTIKELKRLRKVNVYVKRKGAKTRYLRANKGYLTPSEAVKFARYVTDNSRLASFIFTQSKLIKRQRFTISTPAYKFRGRKRTSKLPKGARVEKRKYRLDTSGEKKQISVAKLRRLSNQARIKKLLERKRKNVKRRTRVKRVKKRNRTKQKPKKRNRTKVSKTKRRNRKRRKSKV